MKMKKILLLWILIVLAFPLVSLSAHSVNNTDNTPRYLFVVSVKSGTFMGNQLVVKAMPQVIYFSDRPDHIAGHVRMKHFITAWDQDELKSSPPNATISIISEDSVNNVVIEIQNAQIKNNYVVFTIKVLEGTLPKAFGVASIFIDDSDNPGSIEKLIP